MPRYTHFVAATTRSAPTLDYELRLLQQGFTRVAGIDEVGRGSLAGPVVAAAVILPCEAEGLSARLSEVRDSKQLSPECRAEIFDGVLEQATAVGIGWATHHTVDSIGIAAANRRAMHRAVRYLRIPPDVLLLDHFRLPESDLPQVCVTKGDSLCLSIAAASIVAKVVRDRWMAGCDSRFPGYGFSQNKGYGTRRHLDALERLGPSPLHRKSFAPVALWSL